LGPCAFVGSAWLFSSILQMPSSYTWLATGFSVYTYQCAGWCTETAQH